MLYFLQNQDNALNFYLVKGTSSSGKTKNRDTENAGKSLLLWTWFRKKVQPLFV